MARRMRSGTFVGPGTKRKLRPAIRGIAASFEWGRKTKREPAALAEVTPAPPFCTPCAGPATTRSGRGTPRSGEDRKSTRLNSSHEWISYAVFCLKKKNNTHNQAHISTLDV